MVLLFFILKLYLSLTMDPNKIFGLFDTGSHKPEKTYFAPSAVEPESTFSFSPQILVGMFVKITAQVDDIVLDIVEFLPYEDQAEKDFRMVKYEKLCYDRALAYLLKVDFSNPTHLDYLLNIDTNLFSLACNKLLNFYTRIEEYTTCRKIEIYKGLVDHSQRISKVY